jgi:predicted ferric reductase
VGLYLGLAIGISTWLRPIIGYQLWRRLHILTLVLYALVTVHGIGTGSDTSSWWALGIYVVSIGIVGTLVVVRLLGRDSGTGQQRSHTPAQHRPTTAPSPESRMLVPPRG